MNSVSITKAVCSFAPTIQLVYYIGTFWILFYFAKDNSNQPLNSAVVVVSPTDYKNITIFKVTSLHATCAEWIGRTLFQT